MFEFHSLHTLCHFSSSYYPPQDAPNVNGHGIPDDFWHLNSLLLCRLLLSAHPPLLHNPCFTSPCLTDRTIAWHIGLVYQRAFYHFNAQVAPGPERGQAFGEVGMWGSDGNVDDADGSTGVELCGAELLGQGLDEKMKNKYGQWVKTSEFEG
ncbi:unnamed protein product [Prunus armeniaca]|uniref:Uncharacterized protein n=1 Tax=Prunus armeniaca TaxID=36596 RepID=A0A6J5XXC0_PRUAR|nr:unnamed protein product [Prunus armeniaca]